jgi:putative peptidoglycan lipid II flippase
VGESGIRPARGALAVGAGIFCSRVAGLLRGALLGSVLGVGPHADVLSAAFRLPNLIQNLLGEQTLSASFIPIYARLLGEGRREEAGRFAGAIFALLVAVAGGLALLGVLFARPIVALFATGFLALVGGALQFLIQLPGVVKVLGGWSVRFRLRWAPVREALGAFLPTVAGRGVVQLSSYLDQILASLLSAGAVAALGYAQTLYLLPVSLFGLSLAAAALPELARRRGAGKGASAGSQLRESLIRVSFLNLPSAMAYLLLGLPIVNGVYRMFGGRFGSDESWLVYATLAAYAAGLPAATQSRLLQTGLYSEGDARTPAKWAALRVGVAVAVGIPAMLWLDRATIGELLAPFGIDTAARGSALRAGAVGLALAASIAAWVELAALRRSVRSRLGWMESTAREQLRFLGYAVLAALLPAAALQQGVAAGWHPTARAALLVSVYGLSYLAFARNEEPLRAITARLRRDR